MEQPERVQGVTLIVLIWKRCGDEDCMASELIVSVVVVAYCSVFCLYAM